MVLGGAAVLLAPLAPLPLLLQQGIAGVSGYLVGGLLVAAGLLSWWQAGQRTFLGLAAMALSLASFVTSNFGGFGVGTLLGIVGAAMLVAWLPDKRPARRRPSVPSVPVERPPQGPTEPPADGRSAGRARAVTVAALALFLHAGPTTPEPSRDPAARGPVVPAVSPFTVVPSAHGSVLRAARLTMSGARFRGVAGAGRRYLKLSMDAVRIIDGEHRMGRPDGVAPRQRFASLALSGGVVMYVTRLRARVAGVGFTFTPAFPPPVVPSMTVTGVEADGLLVRADRAGVHGLEQVASPTPP
ncbi:hypothetical protein GCM10023259_089320 [Thermocatellispora tengchongensis]